MKLAGSTPEPAPAESTTIDTPPADSGTDNTSANSSTDEKPFNDEPFNAGVEADENSDPKKFIEQLTGKLGQSLRKYNEAQGQPDFELEKFAINSLLSATHTSEMDPKDQDDIIKKIKEAGNNDDSENTESDETKDTDINSSNADSDDGSLNGSANDANSNTNDASQGGGINEEESLFLAKPKKNNMFQPGSNDKLAENDDETLKESKKSSIFGKIKARLRESLNQEETMNDPMIEPQVSPTPVVEPSPDKVQPNIAPSRKNKPFLPMPEVTPDPKAKN